ncbi:bifunctional 5,10-methylenetetrahydrofolate dehydrogenase/5,10-methenyltetrahydrofolate cyclohydrolase, partial [Candidatus Microgenomates bacterium]|nr:bifunctional 5,10-methylenetetrahydrofolate dehydrogenase/5,10-methenyltetrahydrofolate cyclohydrolase [Candidatus Microgenomates bacterium]
MKIDGKEIAQNILSNLKNRVEKLKKRGVTPHLVIILVGNDLASESYVKQKVQKGETIGIKVTVKNYQLSFTNYQLLETIKQFNNDNNIHGIIVQQPLPSQIDISSIINAVSPQKDVDGFHPQSKFPMPLAEAVLKILESVEKNWQKKKIVIIGKGETGGGPV